MAWVNILDLVYPVGAYYISNNDISPAELFGGSWTQLKSRFLYATTSTSTGGSNTHTLTLDQIPGHAHNIYSGFGDIGNPTMSDDAYRYQFWGGNSRGWHGGNLGTSSAGGGAAHNNMPAYKGVYCWYRTA